MGRMIGLAVVGLGLLLAAGCECGCTKNACPMDAKDEVAAGHSSHGGQVTTKNMKVS